MTAHEELVVGGDEHAQPGRIHELDRRRVEHDRAVALLDDRSDDGPEDRRRHHVDLAADGQHRVIVGIADIDAETIQLAVSGRSGWHYLRHRTRRSWRGHAECPNPHCRRCLR